jgi:sortase (surface protein transpeptidase)
VRSRVAPLLAVAIPATIAAVAVFVIWRGGSGEVEPVDASLTPADLAALAEQEGTGSVPLIRVPDADATGSSEQTLDVKPLEERPAPPTAVSIPALDVDAPVTSTEPEGDALAIPPPSQAGWYAAGPRPGEPGRAVIVGHLDTVDGPAVFGALPEIRRGMTVEVTDRDGARHDFQTIGVANIAKSSFPAQAVFAPSRKPTLALITCSGQFDASTGHYENNLIIFARAA